MKPSFLIAGVGIALAVIFLLQYFLGSPPPETLSVPEAKPTLVPAVQDPPAAQPTPEQAPNQPASPPLPQLDASDPYVRELVANWVPDAWLEPEQLLRRAATVLDNAARGSYPKRQLAFLAPAGDFPVTAVGELYRLNPEGYTRFTPFVDLVESVGADNLAMTYRRLQPLLQMALAELGQRREADELLRLALAEVAAAPLLRGDVMLERPGVLYQFQDEALESRSALQKQLLRMGPTNLARLQAFCLQLAQRLQISTSTGS